MLMRNGNISVKHPRWNIQRGCCLMFFLKATMSAEKLLFACVKLLSVCIQKVAEILDGICVVLDTNVFIWPVHLGTGIAAAD